MSNLYIVNKGAPTIMVRKKFGINLRIASFCLENPMVFEEQDIIKISLNEYHFAGRDGKEWYFAASNVKKVN